MTLPHLFHVFPSFAVGGAQVIAARVMNGLGAGFRHTVVSLDGRLDAMALVDPGIPLASVDGRPLTSFAARRRCLDEASPDLVLTCNWGSMDWVLANALARRRAIHQEHGFGPEESKRQLPRRVWTRRLALCSVRRVIVPSATLARVARETWWLPPARIAHIANGVPAAEPAPPRPPDGGLRIGTVAPLRAEKRLDWLLRAFAGLEAPARLLIAGDGPERGRLEAEAPPRGDGDRVEFRGHLRAPREMLREVDVYALSSSTEQLPMSLLEAMAEGLPVAAVAVGDVAEAVADENRPCIAAADDLAGLTRSLASLAADPALRARLGAANRRRQREHYDEAGMVRGYGALIEAALSAA